MAYTIDQIINNIEAYEAENEAIKENSIIDFVPYNRTNPYVEEVCEQFSIFDWWNDRLSTSNRKQMLAFLKMAKKLGFNGYACFKVGSTGCSNGMWAYKDISTTGFSPDNCDVIYRSFTPEYVEFQFGKNGKFDNQPVFTSSKEFKAYVNQQLAE